MPYDLSILDVAAFGRCEFERWLVLLFFTEGVGLMHQMLSQAQPGAKFSFSPLALNGFLKNRYLYKNVFSVMFHPYAYLVGRILQSVIVAQMVGVIVLLIPIDCINHLPDIIFKNGAINAKFIELMI